MMLIGKKRKLTHLEMRNEAEDDILLAVPVCVVN
jgi:hypothetical protein